jgi:polyribonucleotide nucleotidyltransferase
MKEISHVISTSKGDIKLSTGKIAQLSAGAVMLQAGNTVLLATADYDANDSGEGDFFPLTVEFLERYSAVGQLSGSRFNKREGFPSDQATIISRQIDHTIRPLFPKTFARACNVIITMLSDDGSRNIEELTVLGASAAISISGLPFASPVGSAVITVKPDLSIEVNPAHANDDELLGHFTVAGTADRVLSIEGWGKELTDETMDKVLETAMAEIAMLCKGQADFIKQAAKPMLPVNDKKIAPAIEKMFLETHRKELESAMYQGDNKPARDTAISAFVKMLKEKYATEGSEIKESDISAASEYFVRQIMRENVLKTGQRLSGRKLDEIRPLSAEVDVLPNQVHGSALFNRGLTQSLSTVTLGSTRKSIGFDDMEGEETNVPFMHHYNFPPFSTGEAGRIRYKPGRREIGHGNIGENALRNMIPTQKEFPYTVRAVSEIMTSNGSTSMAATCASSMALMAAGVPMKAAVGGIGVGLITADEAQKDYRLLLDIEGAEDFFGDMDFKVTGTSRGMTAIQFETKLEGVRPEILKESFRLANKGRQQVLEVMNKAISASRTELSPTAPRVEVVHIPGDKIGELIGPGGKVIKGIVERSTQFGDAADVDIKDDGSVTITSVNQEQIAFVKKSVEMIVFGPEIGDTFEAEVVTITDFGAFVNIGYGVEGLVHISEITDRRLERVDEELHLGQIVKVKLIDRKQGKLSFSIKKA